MSDEKKRRAGHLGGPTLVDEAFPHDSVDEFTEPTHSDLRIPSLLDELADADQDVLSSPPSLEVITVREDGVPSIRDTPWRAVEIYTKNRVYVLDAELRCLEVFRRDTGKPESSPFVGARMAGGERRAPGRVEIAHPYPLPGTKAVFRVESPKAEFRSTSQVERVVLRVRLTTLNVDDPNAAWEELSGRKGRPA